MWPSGGNSGWHKGLWYDHRVSDPGFDFDVPNPLATVASMIEEGQPTSALDLLAAIHDRFAGEPDYLLLCARAWRDVGDPLRSQHALLGAIRVAPDDPRPLSFLAELLLERGELDRARRVLDKADALSPFNERIAELRRRSDGLSVLRQSTSTGDRESFLPSGGGLSQDLIALAEQEEKIRPAAPALSRPRSSRGARSKLTVVIGVVVICSIGLWAALQLWTGTTSGPGPKPATEAAAPAAQAERLDSPGAMPSSLPQPPIAEAPPLRSPSIAEPPATSPASSKAARLVVRADRFYEVGEKARAATLYRRAMRLDPDYGPALVGVGRSLLHAKKYDQALVVASRVLQERDEATRSPEVQAGALYQVGRIHHERGDRVAARRILRESTAFAEAPHEAWFYLGETLSRENSPAARSAYERYLSLVPHGPLSSRARRAIR